jgi:hypothetical protein
VPPRGGRLSADGRGRGWLHGHGDADVAAVRRGQRLRDHRPQPGVEHVLGELVRRGEQRGVLDQAERAGQPDPGAVLRRQRAVGRARDGAGPHDQLQRGAASVHGQRVGGRRAAAGSGSGSVTRSLGSRRSRPRGPPGRSSGPPRPTLPLRTDSPHAVHNLWRREGTTTRPGRATRTPRSSTGGAGRRPRGRRRGRPRRCGEPARGR